MNSKDLQDTIISKYQKGDTPTEIHRHLNSGIGLATTKNWCQTIHQSDSTYLPGIQ